MAIFGIGAIYDRDVSDDFIERGVACVGWPESEAPALHEILRCLKVGDIIYIKTAPIGKGLRVKGVGIVINNTVKVIENLGKGVFVNWIWKGYETIGEINDKYNVRNNTLYEEFNKDVQNYILNLMLKEMKPAHNTPL